MFFTKFQTSSIKTVQREFISLKAVNIAQTISLLPEVTCSHNSVITTYCFDKVKIGVFSKYWNETPAWTQYYQSLLGTSEIYIEEVWPHEVPPQLIYKNIILSNYTKLTTKIPILLYKPDEPRTEDYVYAVLTVNTHTRVI